MVFSLVPGIDCGSFHRFLLINVVIDAGYIFLFIAGMFPNHNVLDHLPTLSCVHFI